MTRERDNVSGALDSLSGAGPESNRNLLHLVFLFLVIAAGVLFRLYHLNYPPVDYHNWRQTQTLMVARNFARHDMNLFRPEVDWRTTDKVVDRGVVGGTELQLVPWFTAFLYRIFGTEHWVDRVVPIFFGLLGLVFFHGMVNSFFGPRCATLSTLILSISPMYLYFGRVQMPESFAFAASFAALYYYDRWLREKTQGLFVAAVLSCLLMLLGKPQMGLLILPMFFLTLFHLGSRFYAEWRLYLFAALVSAPFLSFMWYSNKALIAETGISFAQPDLINLRVVLNPAYHWLIWGRILQSVVGYPVAGLAIIGLFIPFIGKGGWLAHVWVLAAVSFFLLMPGGNSANDYYQMMILPPACILAGRALEKTFRRRLFIAGGICLMALISAYDVRVVSRFFASEDGTSERACGQWIDANLPHNALVLSASASPATLYFADRTGWICWNEYFGRKIVFGRALIEQVRKLGATVVAIPKNIGFDRSWEPKDPYKDTRDFLYDSFLCHTESDFSVFLTDRPADLSLPADGTLNFGVTGARKYLRGTWGPNQTVAESKRSFVAMGPSKEGAIRFTPAPNTNRATLTISSAVQDQVITVNIDGQDMARVDIHYPWSPVAIDIAPLVNSSNAPHTILLKADKQNDEKTAILLFSLQTI